MYIVLLSSLESDCLAFLWWRLVFWAMPPLSRRGQQGGEQLTVVMAGISSSFRRDKGQMPVQIYRGKLEPDKSSGLTSANKIISLIAKRQSNKQPSEQLIPVQHWWTDSLVISQKLCKQCRLCHKAACLNIQKSGTLGSDDKPSASEKGDARDNIHHLTGSSKNPQKRKTSQFPQKY